MATESVSWIPSWVDSASLVPFTLRSGDHEWRGARPGSAAWPAVAEGLRRAQEALREVPVRRIVEAVDAVAEQWAKRDFPPRQRVVRDAAVVTGMSEETINRSLDGELGTLRAESLLAALERELGDPEVLDGFRPDAHLRGSTRAIGPRTVLTVFSGNAPGLPARTLVRALLVKATMIAKIPAREPNFTAAFLRTLHEVEPVLADSVLATYWDRDDEETMAAALEHADAVIAYGGDEACAAIRAKVGPHQIYEEHAHKLSFGVVSEDYVALHGSPRWRGGSPSTAPTWTSRRACRRRCTW